MTAPEKIYAVPAIGGTWEDELLMTSPKPIKSPRAVEYTRTNLAQAAIAAAMMGAVVKPLEWREFPSDGQFADKIWLSETYTIERRSDNGNAFDVYCAFWEERYEAKRFATLEAATSAAEADWQARNAAIRVIPTDAMAALDAMMAEAEQRGFDRCKEQAAQIVDPAPNAKSGLWAENLRRKAAEIRALERDGQQPAATDTTALIAEVFQAVGGVPIAEIAARDREAAAKGGE